jgi:hypothetical protein
VSVLAVRRRTSVAERSRQQGGDRLNFTAAASRQLMGHLFQAAGLDSILYVPFKGHAGPRRACSPAASVSPVSTVIAVP